MKKNILFLFIFSILFSCSNKVENVEKAFYYWKSDNYSLSNMEDSLVSKLEVNKLYIKFFEVKSDPVLGLIPISKSELSSNDYWNKDTLKFKKIIPTVYINNNVFIKTSKKEIDTLAIKVNFLLNKYYISRFLIDKTSAEEYQIDCDWTVKSKENYFYFLKKLKENSKNTISCTLRLYPYKYQTVMGIPPVDKVTLMCYNLINPLENHNKNSILDLNELKSYLTIDSKYPVHLDISLPIYSWMQVYQNNKFVKVLYDNNEELKTTVLKPSKEKLWFNVVKDTAIDDFYLRIGDKIKYEDMDAIKIRKAISIIKKSVQFDSNTTITLFHLDENQLKKFTDEEIDSFYTTFSK